MVHPENSFNTRHLINKIITLVAVLIFLYLDVSKAEKHKAAQAHGAFKFFEANSCLAFRNRSTIKTIPVEEILLKGQHLYGDTRITPKNIFPCWMDLKLARVGQGFGRKNKLQIATGGYLTLILILADPQLRRALYSTGMSETPFKAYKRYIATTMQINLWFEEDILSADWIESITRVRFIHDTVGQTMKSKNLTHQFSKPLVTKENNPNGFKVDKFMWEAFKLDLKNGKVSHSTHRQTGRFHQPTQMFNQYLMSISQWTFMSLPLILPTQLGMSSWTELEHKGWAHFWAIISFVLGMDESFIICRDPQDLSGCKKYLKDMLQTYIVPNLYTIDFEGQVMIEAMLKVLNEAAPGSPLPMDYFLIKILEDVVEIPATNMNRRSDWRTRVGRYFSKHWVLSLNRSPIIQRVTNVTTDWGLRWLSLLAFGNTGKNSTAVARKSFVY